MLEAKIKTIKRSYCVIVYVGKEPLDRIQRTAILFVFNATNKTPNDVYGKTLLPHILAIRSSNAVIGNSLERHVINLTQ
jgi:hypothetical protein